jgi:hypothetical protein
MVLVLFCIMSLIAPLASPQPTAAATKGASTGPQLEQSPLFESQQRALFPQKSFDFNFVKQVLPLQPELLP